MSFQIVFPRVCLAARGAAIGPHFQMHLIDVDSQVSRVSYFLRAVRAAAQAS